MSICVLGSINMDIVIGVKDIPKPGETLLSNDIKKVPGGKGANQAVAASRLGEKVYMIGKVGHDENGDYLLGCLKENGIITDYIFKDRKKPTGTAMIAVSQKGQNSIIVIPGSNMEISIEDINKSREIIEKSNILIAQFETPINATAEAFKIAKKKNIVTILNPAPARDITDELLKYTDIIVPNETEAYELTGIKVNDIESAKACAKGFIKKGVKFVIITMGDKGAALISDSNAELIKAYKVKAIDTTAAGDSFIGACSVVISNSKELNYEVVKEAISFGNKVSSIVVQRNGAQPSIPYIDEVKRIYG